MHTLIGIAGLLLAGTLTPGPNNLVVMRQAARAGWGGALPAIVGVVTGSAALLALVAVGGGVSFAAVPQLAVAITGGGCLYLSVLGVRLIRGSFLIGTGDAQTPQRKLPSGVGGLFVFQFLNPKAWVVIVTVVASAQSGLGDAALLSVAALLVLISTAGLVLWSSFGLLMRRYRSVPAWEAWFDRAMGSLLIGSALVLLAESRAPFI